ncbi:MAG TPA: pyridoxamine 5'-phosphate oxidase [Longimicrobiales bacterium]|nr:pyridoxamine 5'-phosphate oxidase [Longimicrobiales bacterium]
MGGRPPSIADLRRDYTGEALREDALPDDPLPLFDAWLAAAVETEGEDPTAMLLATATADGFPSARMVLLKGRDSRGFLFFGDYGSQKGEELEANPRASLVFYWRVLSRQVRVAGTVTRINRAESEAYFRSRPRGSRLSAWASRQSSLVESREALEERVAEAARRFPDDEVPLPERWGGWVLNPQRIEFWQGRESRLHDRIRYVRDGEAWHRERLSP